MTTTVVNIGICVIFLIVAAFWLGKKIAQCRIFKLEKLLAESEKSFKKVTDTFDEVVEFHVREMTKRSDDLKELLIIADKKCILTNDLLTELDELRDEIKKRNLTTDMPFISARQQASEKRLKMEIDDTFAEFKNKILLLNSKIERVEQETRKTIEEIELKNNRVDLSSSDVKEIVNLELSSFLSVLDVSNTYEKNDVKTSSNDVLEKTHDYVDNLRKEKLAVDDSNYKIKGEKQIPPYSATEVLKMHDSGIVIPQIAKSLKMGIGEVKLIIELYGNDAA